jgi:hypothetical protein
MMLGAASKFPVLTKTYLGKTASSEVSWNDATLECYPDIASDLPFAFPRSEDYY